MDSRIEHYEKYYANQAGGGIDNWYRGAPVQRGHGIGSFLGGLFRAALPLIRKGAVAIGKEALTAGVNVLEDVNNGIPLRNSFNLHMTDVSNNLKRKASDKLAGLLKGEGYKRKKCRKSTQLKKVTRRRKSNKSGLKKKVIKRKVKKSNKRPIKKQKRVLKKKKQSRTQRSKYNLISPDIFG